MLLIFFVLILNFSFVGFGKIINYTKYKLSFPTNDAAKRSVYLALKEIIKKMDNAN